MRLLTIVAAVTLTATITGCSQPGQPGEADPEATAPAPDAAPATPGASPSGGRSVYFGDLHVHTLYSFDAFIFGTRATPDDAYRYAKGEAIRHPAGFDVQLDRPLDFYAVTDHAMFLGNLPAWAEGEGATADHPVAERIRDATSVAARTEAFLGMRPYLQEGADNELLDLGVVRSAWADIREAAARHDDPGRFTTFVAYEYTAAPDQQNLHRNVIFRSDAAPELPFSRLDSMNPERLWDWMDELRDRGIESLAIPHNSNGSNGQMFALADWAGDPLDAAYADQRRRNEPLVEITQVKGTSETHPALSPNDEWAGFEIMPYRIATWQDSEPSGSYVREALLNGIAFEAAGGFNPFQFGIVGASDTHTGAASLQEDAYFSKVGLLDATPQLRGSVPLDQPDADGNAYREVYYDTWGASGLTGVWAEHNDRGAIYDAFRRRETFATSGPRIVVRLFAGFGLPGDAHRRPDLAELGYRLGVPMGGDLAPGDGPPVFVASALQDPLGTPLQRLQIVKGWVEDGTPRERIYDVACADGLEPDPESRRCPDNGARVDLETCRITEGRGAAELAVTWQDPDFDSHQEAFYYLRALENPTCRWSTWDAVRAGVAPRPDLAATIQERAWSSPIWYHGTAGGPPEG
ncbi:MAG: hypothetical protein CMQ43_05335 [Gammaproteobacteria bacterium]|nr:hypothetical protein [Gammaproteobacteria bacterium]MBK80322.1 hypothetical protein [Gammaproteobacteria bacterium]